MHLTFDTHSKSLCVAEFIQSTTGLPCFALRSTFEIIFWTFIMQKVLKGVRLLRIFQDFRLLKNFSFLLPEMKRISRLGLIIATSMLLDQEQIMSLISLLSQFLHSCSISCTTLLLCCPLRHLNVRLHETVCVVYLVMTYNLSVNQKLNYCSEIFIKKRYRSLLSISEQLFKKSLLLIHQYEHKHWNLSTLIQANMLRLGGLILN